jgi:hypothetical protein
VDCPIIGACCDPCDGTCVDALTEAECVATGGTWQGACSECATSDCPIIGACCDPCDGSCVDSLTEAECVATGGVWQGACTTCGTVDCPIVGACCDPCDGSCVDGLTEAECVASGGAWQGACSECATVDCPIIGACCDPCDGTCVDAVTQAQCVATGGTWQGACSECATVECPIIGACCDPCDGSCVDALTEAGCTATGGVWQGACSECATSDCPIIGACCLLDGTCLDDVTEADCLANPMYKSWFMCAECTPTLCVDQPERGCSGKGSLVFFSKVEIRWNSDGTQLVQDTFLSLTNDHPDDVRIQMYFINGDEPLAAVPNGERAHNGWNWSDIGTTLTGNQPIFWSAATGRPANGGFSPFSVLDAGDPPGRPAMDGTDERVMRGYVIAWAVNADGEEIRWNHLLANGTILHYGNGSAWEYNACAFPVVNPAIANGEQTGDPGVLNLNGVEYAEGFDMLVFNFQAAGSMAWGDPTLTHAPVTVKSDTDLTLHPLDVDLRQNNDGPVTTKADILVWNENEAKMSGNHRCITCWDQALLSLYHLPVTDPPAANTFLRDVLQTDHGKAQIQGVAGTVCDLDFNPGDGLPVGADPRDVVSRTATMLGVAARLLSLDNGAEHAAAGSSLVGKGFESAVLLYDVPTGSQEVGLPPINPTKRELELFVEEAIRHLEGPSTGH